MYCDDQDPCSIDVCDPQAGCLEFPTSCTCDEDSDCFDPCFGFATCVLGGCVFEDPIECPDPTQECVTSVCVGATGVAKCVDVTTPGESCGEGLKVCFEDGTCGFPPDGTD